MVSNENIAVTGFNNSEKINNLIENKIKLLANTEFAKKKYYTDLFANAVIDRTLKLSKGFRCLIISKNIQCAAIVARCQIDNLARFHGMKLVPGNERDYVYNFLDPEKKFDNLKDNQNEKLSDKYLVNKLNESYQGISEFYNEFCRYVHLSEMHHQSCSRISRVDNSFVEFNSSISEDDQNLEPISYIRLTDTYLYLNNVFLKELETYFSNRKCFPNNNLEVVENF